MIFIGGIVVDALVGIAAGSVNGDLVLSVFHFAAAAWLVNGSENVENWLTLSASELPETAFARTKAARTKRDWEERSPGSPSAPMPLLYVCNGSLSEKVVLRLLGRGAESR